MDANGGDVVTAQGCGAIPTRAPETPTTPSVATHLRRPGPSGLMSSFWRGLRIQWRVVHALIIREIYSRFGRESLGFAWIVAEPLVFALPVLFVWRAVRNPYEHGLSLVPLLYHQRVKILDVFLARALLEIGSNITALLVSFAVFYAIGAVEVPRDLP